MAVIGPFKLNKGWVSDADYWNPPEDGGALTFTGFQPNAGGAHLMDSLTKITGPNTSNTLTGLFYWQDPAQLTTVNTDILIAITQGTTPKAYTSPYNSISWTDRTGAVTLPGGGAGYFTFDVLNGIVLLANNGVSTGAPRGPFKLTTYNGNLAALGGTPPACGIVKCVNNYAFLALDLSATTKMSRVYWSNASDPETWAAANNLDFRYGDGEVISALAGMGTRLIIFKPNSIGSLSVTPIGSTATLGPLVEVTNKIGCVGPLAVDSMPDGTLVFVASDAHLYRFDGSGFTDLSALPWPASNIITATRTALTATSSSIYCAPLYYVMTKVDPLGHRIFVSFLPYTGTTNLLYSYDYFYNSWSDWTQYNNGNEQLFYMNTIPARNNTSAVGALTKILAFGSTKSHAYKLSYAGGITAIDGATTVTSTYENSVVLGGNAPAQFIPRTLILPMRIPDGGGAAGSISVSVGFDGTYPGTPQINALALSAVTGNRITVPIGEKVNTTFKHPLSVQVKIVITANTTASDVFFAPYYLADEVVN